MDKNGSGVFIQRLTNDTSRIADVFNAVLGMTSEIIKYIGILIAIFIVNKLVFLYVFVMIVVLYILDAIRTQQRNIDDKVSRKAKEKVSGFIGELVRGARDIKMLNSEEDFLKELSNKIDDANYKRMKMQKTSWNYKLAMWEINGIFSFILIVILVIFMQNKMILPAVALVLYNYLNNVSYSVYLIGELLEYVKDFNLSSERIYAIIYDDEFKKESFGDKHLDKVNGDFEFKDVSFAYKDKKVLNKLSFKIKANETVAFVGKSGAGKTTIFNLLCKMYSANSGKITLDRIDINELDKDSIRGNITIISQNPYIFNMSIRDNLKLVKGNLTEEEMINACKVACLDEFINELPDGYDTIIGEGGVNLSGGQKQRLAIARALVQNTEIILFDEATSALDNETQEKIQEAIDNMKNEYTILIIAHRLSTIKNADRILYLDNGRIEAMGSHNVLLKTCDKYKKLYESEISKDD
jgi:ABC-type multidrug transport system fused ATPase/permease subunit